MLRTAEPSKTHHDAATVAARHGSTRTGQKKESSVMNTCYRHSAIAMLLGLLSLYAFPADAFLEVCNQAEGKIWIAVAYRAQDGWTSEGWWGVDSGKCDRVLTGDSEGRYYYVYAEREDHLSLKGKHIFCVHRPGQFTIKGAEDCVKRSHEEEHFVEIDTSSEVHWIGRVIVFVNKKGKLAVKIKKMRGAASQSFGNAYDARTYEKINGATMVASDSMMNLGLSVSSLSQVIFSLGTAPL